MRPELRRAMQRWALLLWCCGIVGAIPAASEVSTVESSSATDSAGSLSDSEIEKILTRGRITRIVRLEVGVTHPRRVWVELGKRKISACFKSLDVRRTGITYIAGSSPEINFTDRHLYDQAAYRLDRELELNLVPVSVARQVLGEEGTMILWIDDVFDEGQRLSRDLEPPSPRQLNYRLAAMRVFDALIYNIDRNVGNILYSQADWSLHLIDHTRSFRIYKELPERFLKLATTLPRPLYDRLLLLEEARLLKLLKGLINRGQIRALLGRRDLIIEKIERDRELHGDDVIFQRGRATPTAD